MGAPRRPLVWGEDLDGGLVLVLPDGRVLPFGRFRDTRSPVSAGARRVGFEYTAMRGADALESRFHMLCAASDGVWVDCVDVVTDQNIYPDWNPLSGTDRRFLRGDHTASIVIEGDSILIRGRTLHRKYNGREPTSVDLGTLALLLPPLPR